MKLLGIPGSNSSRSINAQLISLAIEWASDMLPSKPEAQIMDLNDYEMPIYSSDREEADGVPPEAQAFLDAIGSADALVMSFAEHNGNFTAAFKNTFDWASRVNGKVYQDKPVIMMATSPGQRGGASVLAAASSGAPFFGADLVGTFSLPSFQNTFDGANRSLTDDQKAAELRDLLKQLVQRLS